jgi:hypothetical protein
MFNVGMLHLCRDSSCPHFWMYVYSTCPWQDRSAVATTHFCILALLSKDHVRTALSIKMLLAMSTYLIYTLLKILDIQDPTMRKKQKPHRPSYCTHCPNSKTLIIFYYAWSFNLVKRKSQGKVTRNRTLVILSDTILCHSMSKAKASQKMQYRRFEL